jgi:cellulose synthase (UDP-forming)
MQLQPAASIWGIRDDVARLTRRVLVYASMAASLRYIWWRIFETLPRSAWSAFDLFALSLATLEALAIYVTTTGVDFPRDRRARPTLRPFAINWHNRTPDADERLGWYGADAPAVEIFIPTYDEGWSILEKTVVGATGQAYSNFRVWILDDGRREWLREKAQQHGLNYISRRTNEGYKAGNINAALQQLRARGISVEFIALLDADFIARPLFLRRTMALMAESDVGIVQTPQAFYNADPFQQVFGVENWPEEQREWFDVDEPALDATDDALCCGTACLIRGRALEAIGGGFPTDSVTEDTLCSAKMKRARWRTVYLSERLCVGLAAEGISEWFTQRVRWLAGDLQNRRLSGSPRRFFDRLNYWLSYFHLTIKAAKDLGWALALGIFWWSGQWVIAVGPVEAAAYFLPVWCLHVPWIWVTGGRKNFLVLGPQFKLQRFVWLSVPILAAVSRAMPRFEVTQKGRRRHSSRIHWRLLAGHAAIALALAAGLGLALLRGGAARSNQWFWVNAAVSVYLLIETLAAMAPAFERRQRRANDRYSTTESVEILTNEERTVTRATNISLGGLLLERSGEHASRTATVRLAETMPIRVRLTWASATHVAYRFEGTEHRRELIKKIYCSDGYIPLPDRWLMRDALKALLLYLATPVRWLAGVLVKLARH